jgi:hypothetical protein
MQFTYNASALGAGGIVEQGNRTTVISSLASVALAPTGGEGSAVETNYFSEFLAFSRAETRVKGFRQDEKTFTTYADVLVTDLSVFGRLRVALMQATVISTRNIDEKSSRFQLNAFYRDISVDGKDVVPEIDVEISSAIPTYEEFEKLLEMKKKKRDKDLVRRFGAKDVDELLKVVKQKETVQGSIVQSLEHRADLQPDQYVLPVKGLGTAFFGELMLKPERRRVNLLRIELDGNQTETLSVSGKQLRRMRARVVAAEEGAADTGGSMTIASVEGNGSPILP